MAFSLLPSLFFADVIVPRSNSYNLSSLPYIAGEDKSSEELSRNQDEGVKRVEGSREAQEGKLFSNFVSHNECPECKYYHYYYL